MIYKKTETDIKTLKTFLEFWTKFHSIYNDMISSGIITKEDEAKFLETKELIKGKYLELQNNLDFRYTHHGRLTDPVNDLLNLNTIRFISERGLKKTNDDWRDSYIFLNSILERLKNNKRRLERFNPVGVFLKRMFSKRSNEARSNL